MEKTDLEKLEDLKKERAELGRVLSEATSAANALLAEKSKITGSPAAPVSTLEEQSLETKTESPDYGPELASGVTAEDTKQAKEAVKKLTKPERQKVGWGIRTFGFKVEQIKNNVFADAFRGAANLLGVKNTTARFCNELSQTFERDSKMAYEKATDKRSVKLKQLQSVGYLVGNVARYGRLVGELAGAAVFYPHRVAMLGFMALSRGSEALKETLLKSEDNINRTRIEDIEQAADEAWAIYENAKKNTPAGEKVSADSLKQAYLIQMPKDITARLERQTDVANGMVQGLAKKQISLSMGLLDREMQKIDNNPELTDSEKENKKIKILKSWEKILTDYDRMISQWGTVELMAALMRLNEKVARGSVHILTAQAIVISADRLYESVSNMLTSADAHDAAIVNQITSSPTPTPETTPAPTPIPGPEVVAPVAHIQEFKPEVFTFDQGKGGIQGILELKEQIRAQYPDISKAPQNVQEFLNVNSTKQAIEFGLFKPGQADESAFILKGSTLRLDESGQLIFHDAKTGEDIVKYEGRMFDSDNSGLQKAVEAEIAEVSSGVDAAPESAPKGEVSELARNYPSFEEQRSKIFERLSFTEAETAAEATGEAGAEVSAEEASLRGRLAEYAREGTNASAIRGANEVYQYNLRNIFPDSARMEEWNEAISKMKAKEIWENRVGGESELDKQTAYGHIFYYIQKLERETGIKPRGGFWRRDENVAEYIGRALRRAAELGKLDKTILLFKKV